MCHLGLVKGAHIMVPKYCDTSGSYIRLFRVILDYEKYYCVLRYLESETNLSQQKWEIHQRNTQSEMTVS